MTIANEGEFIMTMLAMMAIVLGGVLGLRLKVLVLLPATGLAVAAVVSHGIVRADPLSRMALSVVLVAAALQVGYFAAIVTRHALARMASQRSVRSKPAGSFSEGTH